MNDRQKRFIDEYLVDLNGTQAAIRAGYAEKSASVHAARMLANPIIREAIDERMNSRAQKTGRTALEVLEDIQALTKEAWRSGDYKAAFRGLELEGKHLGMFKEKVEAELSGGISLGWER